MGHIFGEYEELVPLLLTAMFKVDLMDRRVSTRISFLSPKIPAVAMLRVLVLLVSTAQSGIVDVRRMALSSFLILVLAPCGGVWIL